MAAVLYSCIVNDVIPQKKRKKERKTHSKLNNCTMGQNCLILKKYLKRTSHYYEHFVWSWFI